MPDAGSPVAESGSAKKRQWWARIAAPTVPFLAAVQFLTVSPPVVRRLFTRAELGRAVAYYPVVGLLLGALLAGLAAGLARVFAPGVVAALLLAVWVLLTGALHLDGFLDSCDGLLGGRTPERRLEIMRDERVGAFGVAGGALLLLLKYSALSSLLAGGGVVPCGAALALAPALGRWGMALVVGVFPYGRAEGLGRTIKDNVGPAEMAAATLATAVAAALFGGRFGLAAVALAVGVSWGAARFALARLPGLTGDLYGAVCEIVETAALLFFALQLG